MSHVPLDTFALTSVAGALVANQFFWFESLLLYIWLVALLFVVQLFLFAAWRLVLFPRYFSSLRHLPQPSVSVQFAVLQVR
jgi:hypothetical protein